VGTLEAAGFDSSANKCFARILVNWKNPGDGTGVDVCHRRSVEIRARESALIVVDEIYLGFATKLVKYWHFGPSWLVRPCSQSEFDLIGSDAQVVRLRLEIEQDWSAATESYEFSGRYGEVAAATRLAVQFTEVSAVSAKTTFIPMVR
jgi:hypothetical protein